MRAARSFSAFLPLLVLALCSCKSSNPANAAQASAPKPTPLTTIPTTQGGIIEYGSVAGATTLPAAMANVLSQMHQACGEKPSVGQVFRVKGSNSAGVIFTVVDHAQGNRQLAGMVIAAQTAPNQMEAAVVSDSADRFAQTANPMLQQLYAVWHPGQTQPASGTSGSSGSASTASTASPAPPVPLHTVTAPDNSASLGVPDGWTLNPQSGQGAIIVKGPNGEQIGMNMNRPAVDPTNPFQVNMARQRYSVIVPGSVVYAFRGDLTKEFVNVFQAWRKAGGQGPAQMQVDTIVPMQAPKGSHCVQATGHIDPDGKGMQAFNDMMCANDPVPAYGGYGVTLYHAMLPNAVADKEQGLQKAIISSYKENAQVVSQQINAQLNQKQQMDQQTLANAQQYVNQIHQIGAQATARMNATEAANDAQHAGYWAQQSSNAQNSAGFSNYLLDQSVVQNNNVGGTGAVGHTTEWNSAANAMVQANPNKYEIVNTPNYWQGVDY